MFLPVVRINNLVFGFRKIAAPLLVFIFSYRFVFQFHYLTSKHFMSFWLKLSYCAVAIITIIIYKGIYVYRAYLKAVVSLPTKGEWEMYTHISTYRLIRKNRSYSEQAYDEWKVFFKISSFGLCKSLMSSIIHSPAAYLCTYLSNWQFLIVLLVLSRK